MYKMKKAQTYAALTWLVAFLIIFFLMMIFLFFTLIASRSKSINVETVKYNSEKLESQRFLISLLNDDAEYGSGEFLLKSLINEWMISQVPEEKQRLKLSIEHHLKKRFEESENCCVFQVLDEVQQKVRPSDLGYESQEPMLDPSHSIEVVELKGKELRERLLPKSVDLFLEGGKLKIRFYTKKC